MSAGNDWWDPRHMGSTAAGAIAEMLGALGADEKNVKIVDLAPPRGKHEKNGPVGVYRVEVSQADENLPGASYTVVVT